jgi:hypothetical protein
MDESINQNKAIAELLVKITSQEYTDYLDIFKTEPNKEDDINLVILKSLTKGI